MLVPIYQCTVRHTKDVSNHYTDSRPWWRKVSVQLFVNLNAGRKIRFIFGRGGWGVLLVQPLTWTAVSIHEIFIKTRKSLGICSRDLNPRNHFIRHVWRNFEMYCVIAFNTGIFLTCEWSRNVWCNMHIFESERQAYCTKVEFLDFQIKVILEKSYPDILVFTLKVNIHIFVCVCNLLGCVTSWKHSY